MLRGFKTPVATGHAEVLAALDFETYSEAGLVQDPETLKWKKAKKNAKSGLSVVGTWNYSEHPSTELKCLAYDLKDGIGWRLWTPELPPPQELFDYIKSGGLLEAAYSLFEYSIWRNVCARRLGWPPLPLLQLRDALAKASAWGVPGSLDAVGEALNAGIKKDKVGTAIMKKLSAPRQPTKKDKRRRFTPEDDPEEFLALYMYCVTDIDAQSSISQMIPDLPPRELEIWKMDQRMNVRGIHIDRKGMDACLAILGQLTVELTQELFDITDGRVQTADQIKVMKEILNDEQGVKIPNMKDETITEYLELDLPPLARRILEIRQTLGMASVKKLYTMQHLISADDRVRGALNYHKAATGRWASGGLQVHNFTSGGPAVGECSDCGKLHNRKPECPRCGSPVFVKRKWGIDGAEAVLEDMAHRDIDHLKFNWGKPALAISGVLRSLVTAGPGHDFICSDYNSIEARMLAYLAGEQWRLDVFHTHGKIYEMSASKLTGIPLEEILDHPKQNNGDHHNTRKIGKVLELACLGPDTLVLTDKGYIKLINITTNHKLWDGEQWVNHKGVIAKGSKDVLVMDGVVMTKNHEIISSGLWMPARRIATNPAYLTRALAKGSENLPSSIRSYGTDAGALDYRVRAGSSPLTSISANSTQGARRNADNARAGAGARRNVYDIAHAGPRNRFTIKTDSGHLIVHNCGYGGWIGAFKAFGGDNYIDTDEEMKKVILKWRAESPAIIEYWGGQYRHSGKPWKRTHDEFYGVEGAAVQAVLNPKKVFHCGLISFCVIDNVLYNKLPSGRLIAYHRPRVRLVPNKFDIHVYKLTYWGMNGNPKRGPQGKWMEIETYGGSLVESIVQGACRDWHAYAMVELDKKGYAPVFHVHDEPICEVPHGFGSIEELEATMMQPQAWAPNCPIKASGGYRGLRFRK